MRCPLLVALSLQLACAGLAAQAATGSMRATAAQDSPVATLRLGYARVALPLPVALPPAPPLPPGMRPAAVAAGLRAPPWPRLPRLLAGAPAREPPPGPAPQRALAVAAAPAPTAAPDTARPVAILPVPVDSSVVNLLPGTVQDFADIGMRVQGRGDLGGAWIRYRPCEPGLRLNCNPGLFPRMEPDVQFGVQVGGTISDRVHIDVDWDQRREFDATNNINVYYQGLKGEALQRVEVGDVSIRLPQSRYLARGIPAGNFGFKATGRVGGMDMQAVWAQQKGDVATRQFQLDQGGGGQAGLVQDAALVLDDADYVRGQFFFAVDPTSLTGSPSIDALTLRAGDAPEAVRPRPQTLAVYRDEGNVVGNFQQQAQPGYFLGDAANGGVTHSGLFRLLQPGVDYVVHPSGLWLMLRVPLRPDEALAVSYVTAAGDTVGTPGAEQVPPGQTPHLFLIRGPETSNQPNAATWQYEMHQVYRLDTSSGVELPSVDLTISLGQASAGLTFRSVQGRRVPYLRLFGLDEDPPTDKVDASQIFRPSDFGPFAGDAFRGTFVLFPALEPFGRPPPVPSEGLTASQNAALLGNDANTDIYDVLDPVERRSSARFRLSFNYRVRSEGVASTFNLGALGIREGSEHITLDGQPLKRGVDYVIDYDLGTVTLLNPQATLGANPQGQIRASWEQQSLFQVAPTTVFGLTSRYALGTVGEVDFTGMYQSEKTLMTRPQLGTEPGAIMLGGASTQLNFGASWLDDVLARLPLHGTDSSTIAIHSELATSRPDPNTRGDTYLDDFESTDELSLSLEQHSWRLGSMPQDATGATTVLPWPLGLLNATPLVWQDRYLQAGREVGFLQPQQIDRQINVAGARLAERALYLTVGDPSVITTQPRWRSIVTPLSSTGLDLSRSEYLEFYAG
ncbi:MAG TPA: cell surface protein SprA, partial [Longimicrobiales bacterium]|nr:cell surface protein SprA [Longimicrobiales bacterium]